MRRRAQTISSLETEAGIPSTAGRCRSIPPEQSDELALDADAIGRKDSYLIGGIGRLECNRGPAAAETLERGLLLIDQRHHDVAGIGPFRLLEERNVAIEDTGLDHAVAADFEGEVLAARQQIGRHVDDVALRLDRLDRRAGGNASHYRHRDGAAAFVLRCSSHTAEIALDHARCESAGPTRADPRGKRFG